MPRDISYLSLYIKKITHLKDEQILMSHSIILPMPCLEIVSIESNRIEVHFIIPQLVPAAK